MKRSTINIIQGSASNVIQVKLGDIFFINSKLKAHNNNELSEITPVASMIVSIKSDKRVWMFSACIDRSQYTISRINDNKIILVGKREITFNINDIKNILTSKIFPIKALGIRIYGAIVATSEKLMSQMDMVKINARIPDVSKWPNNAVATWAKRQHGLKSQELSPIVAECNVSDGNKFVNSIILSSMIKRNRSAQVKKKQESTKAISDKIASIIRYLETTRIWRSLNTRFIKIYNEEVVSGDIKFGSDFKPENLLYYSVLIVNNIPGYILIRPDEDGDTSTNFRFINGTTIRCKMLSFTIDNFRWALERLGEEEAIDRSISIPTVQDPSPTTLDLGAIEQDPSTTIFDAGALDLRVNALSNVPLAPHFMVNSRLQNATVSIDADGDLISIDTTEMEQAPSEAEEPEVATEDQENHEE
ncbi:hypothetical protein LCGC14_1165410 [marine sediment metagenome]|uniref:Uncharacterized protein n=1 Tax=marine sediment metagenome TaxID=412755 RepID=A0A0F9LRH9_9ZZZZ